MQRIFSAGGVPKSSKLKLVGDLPQDHAHAALLLEDGDAKRARSPNAKPKSAPPFSWSSFSRPLGGDALHQGHRVFRLEDLGFQPFHVAVKTQHGRLPDGNVQVARLAFNDRVEKFIDQNSAQSQLLLLPRWAFGV